MHTAGMGDPGTWQWQGSGKVEEGASSGATRRSYLRMLPPQAEEVSGRWGDADSDKQRCAPDCTAGPVYPRWSNLEGVSGQNSG